CTTVNEGFAHEENAIRIIWSAHHYLTREQSARPFSRKNLIEARQENDALALNVKEVDRYRQTGNEFRRVNDPGGKIARIFGSQRRICVDRHRNIHLGSLEFGKGGAKQFVKRWLAKSFSPGRSDRQTVIERLPSHPKLGDEDVRVVIQIIFKANRSGELQGMKSRDGIGGAKNRNIGLSIDTVRLASRTRAVEWRFAEII